MKLYIKKTINNSWFAGFFEGDGTAFEIYSKNQKGVIYYKPIVQLFQSDIKILKLITTLVAGQIYLDNSPKDHKKNAYRIVWQSKKASSPILSILRKEFLSQYRQSQVLPLLKKLKLKNCFKEKINWSWLSGFFIAEGCIYESKKTNNKQLIFSQTNQEILDVIEKFLKDKNINCYRYKKDIRVHNKKDYSYLIKKLCVKSIPIKS